MSDHRLKPKDQFTPEERKRQLGQEEGYYSTLIPAMERIYQKRFGQKHFAEIDQNKNFDTHSHEGVTHMSALIHVQNKTNLAGAFFPRLVVNTSNGLEKVHTPEKLQDLTDEFIIKDLIVEMAKETVKNRVTGMISDYHDESKTEDERFDAWYELSLIYEGDNFANEVLKEAKQISKKLYELPEDLPTLKQVIASRLEAEANKNIKRIKNAVTQQGVDMPASCDDQENAIRELAAIKQLSQLNINALETAANVKAEYDKAVKKMADVTPLNTPIYLVPGNPTPLASPYAPSSAANRFTLRIRNPAGVEGVIETEITRTGNAAHKIEHIFLDTKFRFLLLTITPGTEASEFSVISRNLCGPGKPFVIEVPAKS